MSDMLDSHLGDSTKIILPMTWEGYPFEPGDLPGGDWFILSTIKRRIMDPDADAVVQKALGAGITVSGSEATIQLISEDTDLLLHGVFWIDIRAFNTTTGEARTVSAPQEIKLKFVITRDSQSSIPIHTTEDPYPWVGPVGPQGPPGPGTHPTLIFTVPPLTTPVAGLQGQHGIYDAGAEGLYLYEMQNGLWRLISHAVAPIKDLAPADLSKGLVWFDSTIGRHLTRYGNAWVADAPCPDAELGIRVRTNLIPNMINEVDSRLAGKTPSVSLALFVSYNVPYNNIGMRNPGAWCANIEDITCISPWNSHEGYARAGTLIAPDIIILANHFPINNGSTIKFITMTDVEVSKTIVSQMQIASVDICIAKLDSPVPDTIRFAKLLPQAAFQMVAAQVNAMAVRIPALRLDQEEKALVGDTNYLIDAATFYAPVNAKRLEFYEEVVTYDSGNPAFWVCNGQLVILTTWYTGGGGSGPSIHYYRNQINAGMTALGSAHQLTDILLP